MISLILAFLLSAPQVTDAEYNTPAELKAAFRQASLQDYQISQAINPFYLRGDFDGDRKADLAVLVTEKSSGRRGIVIALGRQRDEVFVIGAGTDFLRSDGYSYKDFRFPSWTVFPRAKVRRSVHDTGAPPVLRGEAILVEWPEAGSGIVYWDGKRFRWYHISG
jgi:hypothetical protein